jgi:hypothetical protein
VWAFSPLFLPATFNPLEGRIMLPMKKTLYTLCVDDYEPDICAITFPLMRHYAEKIRADFFIIKERKSPHLPPVMEKFQIFDLGREHKNDWNIFFDADTVIHPDFFDVTNLLHKSVTASHGTDFSLHRFRADKYFLRDGRYIGKGNWCAIASDWCLDYWHPLDDVSYEDAVKDIYPTATELNTIVIPNHLIDDYLVSRNIARFGLKHVIIPEIITQYRCESPHLGHQYTIDGDKKIVWMKELIRNWGIAKIAQRLGVPV